MISILKQLLIALTLITGMQRLALAQSPCDVVQVKHIPRMMPIWSPDSSRYFINVQDTGDVYQIYVGVKGDTTLTCISNKGPFGWFRPWIQRNKMQVQWHPSSKYIICAVEKEYYQELLYVPYNLRLGWLQSGIWMDVWATKPDGSKWYNLAVTEAGVTGPAFTPDGTKCAWAEGEDSSNLTVDIFGKWHLNLCNFALKNDTPYFATTTNIQPTGARWIEPGNFAPDGKRLLISSDIGMTNAEGQDQYILDITTGNVTNLNNTPKIWDEHGLWSPDGSKIVFMSSYPYRADTNSYHTISIKTEFMLMDADGSNLQQLTHYCTPGYPESHPGIAAVGYFGLGDSAIYAISLVFPFYENWIIKFKGNCGYSVGSAIDEVEESGVMLYPNPVKDELNIRTRTTLSAITVTNMLGQTVKYISAPRESSIGINTRDLPAGMYVLQANSGKERISRLFVKE